jgi:hypothetical protein
MSCEDFMISELSSFFGGDKIMWRFGFACFVFAAAYFGSANLSSGATIRSFQPSLAEEIAGFRQAEVFFDGEITKNSLLEFHSEIESKNIKYAKVYFNSNGGDLLSGIKLGSYIRSKGFSTAVGIYNPDNKLMPMDGACLSACVLSYAGGYYRFASEKDRIGVHRFYAENKTESDLDIAQIISAAIVAHLRDMGVDTRLFDLMTVASGEEIYILNSEEKTSLGIVNNGILPAKWTLETEQGLVYLKGEQDTGNGIGKFILMCEERGRVLLMPFYEAGYNAETIATTSVRWSLRVNSQFIPLGKPIKPPVVSKNYVTALFGLNRDNINKIMGSEEVGFAFHPGNPELFWGFTVNPVNKEKIKSFLMACGAI